MDWETLRPVIIGGLIATIPILISNLVQIYLKRMEIKQKEKEARIQVKEKWIELDILEGIHSLENIVNVFSELRNLEHIVDSMEQKFKDAREQFGDEEYERLKSYMMRQNNLLLEGAVKFDVLGSLIHSIAEPIQDNDILESFGNLSESIGKFFESSNIIITSEYIEKANKDSDKHELTITWVNLLENSGRLRSLLREKLISIRESE